MPSTRAPRPPPTPPAIRALTDVRDESDVLLETGTGVEDEGLVTLDELSLLVDVDGVGRELPEPTLELLLVDEDPDSASGSESYLQRLFKVTSS